MADLHFILMFLTVSLVTPTLSGAQNAVAMPNITLVAGTSTYIQCGYDVKGYFVSWQRGDIGTFEANEDLVALDKRSHPSTRTYDADRFNISADNSLTIEDIHLQDEGRYFCTVFHDTTTSLITEHHIDVVVEKRVVIPETLVTLQLGRGATIPCRSKETATTTDVRWMKDGLQIGDDNRYQSSTEDHSLLFRHVTVMDGGSYVCEYFNSNEKTRYQHVAQVTVIGTPERPFPIIDECDANTERTTQNCTYESSKAIIIRCLVNNFFPNISLVFLHNQEIMEVLTSKESSNSDGTKNKEIFVRAAPSDEPYVCMAQGIPGIDGERGVLITITEGKPPAKVQVLSVIVGALVSVVIILLIKLYMYWKYIYRREKGYTLDEERHAIMLSIGVEAGCQTQALPSADADTGYHTQPSPSADAETGCQTQSLPLADADTGYHTLPSQSAGADEGCQTQHVPSAGADAGCQTQPSPSAGADAECQTQLLPLAGQGAYGGCETQPSPSAGADARCQTEPVSLAGRDAEKCQAILGATSDKDMLSLPKLLKKFGGEITSKKRRTLLKSLQDLTSKGHLTMKELQAPQRSLNGSRH